MAASSCTPHMFLPQSNVESDEEDSDELRITWSGSPQPIYFPFIKKETEDEEDIVELSLDSEDEVIDLCSPSSVIDLIDSDDEDVVEHHKESEDATENNICQHQYDIDLTVDEEDNDIGIDAKNEDGGYTDNRVDNSDKGNCEKLSVGYTDSQSCMDSEEVEVCDSSCVVRPSYICKACNKCFISVCNLYLPGLVKEVNYWCTICMTLHKNENGFYEHLKCHSNRYVTCDLCKVEIESVQLACGVCSCNFDSEELYKQHQEIHAGQQEKENVKLSCSVCKRNFTSKKLLEIHERLHTEELFKCDSCGGQFWTQQILVEHQEFCNALETTSWLKCTLCQKGCRTQSAMIEHLKLCMQSRSRFYYCEICPQLFPCADSLVVHRQKHISSKSQNILDCDCCDMKFFCADGLAVHKYSTSGKITYSCSPCNIQFLVESSFVSHLCLLHSAEVKPSNSNTNPKNIIVEKIGLDAGKTCDGNKVSQPTRSMEKVNSDELGVSKTDVGNTSLKSASVITRKNMPRSSQPSELVENGNGEFPAVISIQSTPKKNSNLKKISSSTSTSIKQVYTISSSPEDKHMENVAVEKNKCDGKIGNDDISKYSIVDQLLHHNTNEKFILHEKKVEKLVINQDSSPCPLKNPVPTPSCLQHSSSSLNQMPSLISKRFCDNINCPDDIPVKKHCKYSGRNHADSFAAIILPNHCSLQQSGTQKAEVIPVTSSSKCSSVTYPVILPESTVGNMKPLVRNNFKILPSNRLATIKPQLLQVYDTASSHLKQTNNCSKVGLPTSEVCHIVTYADTDVRQKISPTFIITSAIGTANVQCPSKVIKSLSVGNTQAVQKFSGSSPKVLENSNIQPGPYVLAQNSVSNNRIMQSNSTMCPVTLQNANSNLQANSLVLQSVNIIIPQMNQDAGSISIMLPVNGITETSPVGKSKKLVSTPRMISQNNFIIQVNPPQPEVGVGKNHMMVSSQTVPQNKLTSKRK